MERISVVVPVYNGEKFVEQCLERLTSEREYLHEIIIVNDGSRDATENLLKKYESDEKVVVITQENQGVSAARNHGINASTGDWIVFCDVDDEIKEGFFRDISESLEERKKTDLICFARGKVGAGDVGKGDINFDKKKTIILSLGQDIDNYLNDYIFMSVWSKVFRRDILTKHNIFFNEKVLYAEDALFLMEYITKAERIDLIHRGYYVYLPNDEGACKRGGSIKDYEGFFTFDKEMNRIIDDNASLMMDEDIMSVIRNYMLSLGRIMCGRVVRGTRGQKISERSKLVKAICKKCGDYCKGASIKQRIVLNYKKYFTRSYILASDKK